MEQEPIPNRIQEKDSVDQPTEEKQELIKTRKFRNLDRGTEIEFATIPLADAKKLDEGDVDKILKEKFGENTYLPMTGRLSEISLFLNNQDVDTMLLMVADKSEKLKKLGGHESAKYLTLRKIGEKLLITPTPFIHDLFIGGDNSISQFDDVKSILEHGFARPEKRRDDNALVKGVFIGKKEEHRINLVDRGNPSFTANEGVVKGDAFSFELYADSGSGFEYTYNDHLTYNLKKAGPERILSINIRINPEATEKEKDQKIKFYKEEITKRYNIPIRFFQSYQEGKKDDENGTGTQYSLKRIFPKK